MKKWIGFFEIPSGDYKRAVRFYSEIFGQELQACDFGPTQMAFFPADESGTYGAVINCEGFEPSSNGVIISFAVEESIEPFLDRVQKAKGKVIIPKSPIGEEGKGYYALFSDSEGNRIGLHSHK